MKFTNTNSNNSILSIHYSEYLEILDLNGELFSQNLTDIEFQNLYNKKYKLTELDIYKYIVAIDYINESLGFNKYSLTKGIINDYNKYNNILRLNCYFRFSKVTRNYKIILLWFLR